MRTLGPGSIASVLKIALDVAYAVVWAALILLAAAVFAGALASPFLAGRPHEPGAADRLAGLDALLARWPAALGAAGAAGLYLAVLLVIFFRLRQVFATLTRGDPFRPENVGRLRTVGLALVGLEAAGYLVRLAAGLFNPARADRAVGGVSLSAGFAILVVFVLAEVFRVGARLRRDAELTI